MRRDKRSFFERLTGAISMDEDEYDYEDDFVDESVSERPREHREFARDPRDLYEQEPDRQATPFDDFSNVDNQLTVDVMQTPDDIIIKTIVAGIEPENLDVAITRDTVTIKGSREEETSVHHNDYYHRELAWGSFSRSISLPAEIDVEQAEAIERHGLLTLRLPKIDKSRQTKLQIRSGR